MRTLCFIPMVVTLFFAGYGEASSILLDLGGSEKRCIADSVQRGADTTFRYRVAEGYPAEKVKVTVTDPMRGVARREDLLDEWSMNVIDNEKHPNGGTYKICFQNNHGEETRVEVQHDLIPEDGESEGSKAHKLLKNSKQMLDSLKNRMKETRTGEDSDEHEQDTLRSRINTGSCFTMVVLIASSAWQLVLLNKFFRSKNAGTDELSSSSHGHAVEVD